jgi:hypothetical protein
MPQHRAAAFGENRVARVGPGEGRLTTHCRHSTDTPPNHPGASGLWGAPLSTVRGIRGSCGGDVPIERRGRDAEAVRDLSHADVGIGEQRLGGLDVVVREFRRPGSGAASAPRGGKPRLGALPDQAALKFR